MFFRKLNAEETGTFCAWARANYQPGSTIDGAWHPVVQAECARINKESAVFVADREEPC